MGKLEDLRENIASMSADERLAKIIQIRADRKVHKNPEKEKKARKQKAASHDKLVDNLKKLTPAQLRELGLVS